MVSKAFVAGWALIVIGCCGKGPGWVSALCGVIGLLIVWFGDNSEGQP